MTQEQRDLNNWLRESYGRSLTGKAKFRLVWSEDILEKRKGEFNEFYGQIFLRTVTGVRELKKYNYIIDRFILEAWVDNDLSSNGEVPDAINGDYVPVYVFEDKNGNTLPITRKVLAFLIKGVRGEIKKDSRLSEDENYDKDIARVVESFDDHPSYFSTHGEIRNAVAYTGALKGK